MTVCKVNTRDHCALSPYTQKVRSTVSGVISLHPNSGPNSPALWPWVSFITSVTFSLYICHLGVAVMNLLTVSCEGEVISHAFCAQHNAWAGPQLSWFVMLYLSFNSIQLIWINSHLQSHVKLPWKMKISNDGMSRTQQNARGTVNYNLIHCNNREAGEMWVPVCVAL